MEDKGPSFRFIIINLLILDVAVIGFTIFLVKSNVKGQDALQPRPPLESTSPSPSPLAVQSPSEISFQEYYKIISDERKKCISGVFGEEKITSLLKENPFLSDIPLTDDESRQLSACFMIE